MPLIALTGYPCSGKSTRAQQLQQYFSKQRPEVTLHVISEESLNIDRNISYASRSFVRCA
jgi:protein KTI12